MDRSLVGYDLLNVQICAARSLTSWELCLHILVRNPYRRGCRFAACGQNLRSSDQTDVSQLVGDLEKKAIVQPRAVIALDEFYAWALAWNVGADATIHTAYPHGIVSIHAFLEPLDQNSCPRPKFLDCRSMDVRAETPWTIRY